MAECLTENLGETKTSSTDSIIRRNDDDDGNDDETTERDLDITHCNVCRNICRNPKTLPCIHAFCLKCLEEKGRISKKKPGDKMPCPVCRNVFIIPLQQGFAGLPRDAFIDRLVEETRISRPPSNLDFCEACQSYEEEKGLTPTNIPPAKAYCMECRQRLCDDCWKDHGKNRVSKDHQVTTLGSQLKVDEPVKKCEQHETSPLNVYCIQCKEVVCDQCYKQSHRSHLMKKIEDKIVAEIRKAIRKCIDGLPGAYVACNAQGLRKSEILSKIDSLKDEVIAARDELIDRVGHDAETLLDELDTLQMTDDDLQRSVNSYKKYCKKLLVKGTATEIVQAFDDLTARLDELREEDRVLTRRQTSPFDVCFTKNDIGKEINFVGTVGGQSNISLLSPGNTAPLDTTTLNVPPVDPEDNDRLNEKTIKTMKNNRSFLLENIQPSDELIEVLKECIPEVTRLEIQSQENDHDKNEELLSWMSSTTTFTQFHKVVDGLTKTKQVFVADLLLKGGVLVKSKVSCKRQPNADPKEDELVEKLNELEYSVQTSIGKSDRIVEDLAADEIEIAPFCHRQDKGIVVWFRCQSLTSLNRLREMYAAGDSDKDNLLGRLVRLFKYLSSAVGAGNRFTQSGPVVPTNVSIYNEDFMKTFSNFQKMVELSELLGKPPSDDQTVLVEDNCGLAIVDKKLFVVTKPSVTAAAAAAAATAAASTAQTQTTSEYKIKVYDLTSFEFIREWTMIESEDDLHDVRSCSKNKCLYFLDFRYQGSCTVHRVNLKGKIIKEWKISENEGYSSVTHEGNIIFTDQERNRLNEYSPEGQLIAEIQISSDAGVVHPIHAVKLTSGHFVVSYGKVNDRLQGVCLLDATGKVTRSFDGEKESRIRVPACLAVDSKGSIYVADHDNRRVLLLSSTLELKRVVVSAKDGLGPPVRVYLDEPTGRIFVADRKPRDENTSTRIILFHNRLQTQNSLSMLRKDNKSSWYDHS